MIATLVLGCVLSGAAGFLAGWWRGRQDHAKDIDDDLGKCLEAIEKIRTECQHCGADFKACCPNGCLPTRSQPR